MIRTAITGLALWLAASASATGPAWTPVEPDVAIAAVNSNPGGVRGRFVMTVRGFGQRPGALYLNSTDDYKAPENLTFHLPPSAARALERKLGGPLPGVVGRRVVVEGRLTNVPIYKIEYGRPKAFLRMQHTVRLRQASGVIAVE